MQEPERKKILVTGCFDLLHSGHIRFLEESSAYGKVYVSLGNDINTTQLKGVGHPLIGQEERRYILKSLRFVEEVIIPKRTGRMDGIEVAEKIHPDMWIVNEDGDCEEKRQYCTLHGIEYKVLQRIPSPGLPARSSTEIRQSLLGRPHSNHQWISAFGSIPYRLALAGGWIDQPFMSQYNPDHFGSMVVVCIEPEFWFMDRAGICSSTRRVAERLWGSCIPDRSPDALVRELYVEENRDKAEPSGSQDMIGIIYPGINRLDYDYQHEGGVYPVHIESCLDADVIHWLESVLWILPVNQRPLGYKPLQIQHLNPEWVKGLGNCGKHCFTSICRKDLNGLGESLNENSYFSRQILPCTIVDSILPDYLPRLLGFYQENYIGATYSSCGGGYLFVVSATPVPGAFQVRVAL